MLEPELTVHAIHHAAICALKDRANITPMAGGTFVGHVHTLPVDARRSSLDELHKHCQVVDGLGQAPRYGIVLNADGPHNDRFVQTGSKAHSSGLYRPKPLSHPDDSVLWGCRARA